MNDELQELERELLRLMKEAGKQPKQNSLLYADALKKIQAAKKSGSMQDILAAYDIVLDLGYLPSARRDDDIHIVIDALAHYAGRFVPTKYRNNAELMAQVHDLDDVEDPLIQQYAAQWGIQACYKSNPEHDGFWQAWGKVYEIAIRYRCEVQAQVIRRLFAVHDRDLNIRKVG